jgi:hypothetical protein
MTPKFTLYELQQATESILGRSLHKQNFRRAIEKSGLVDGLGEFATATGGRPAELFKVKKQDTRNSIATGITTPYKKS